MTSKESMVTWNKLQEPTDHNCDNCVHYRPYIPLTHSCCAPLFIANGQIDETCNKQELSEWKWDCKTND